MRNSLGLIGLVIALLTVALLARKAFTPTSGAPPATNTRQGTTSSSDAQLRSAQVQQQVQQGLDAAAETARRQREAADQ